MKKRSMVLVALVLILLVAAVLFSRRAPSSSETPATATVPGAPAAGTPSAPATGLPGQAAGTPPPWAAGGGGVPTLPQAGSPINGLPSPAGSAAGVPYDRKALEKMQQELAASMRAGQQPDPKQVEALLNELKQKHGPTVAGVNLDVVIKNLQIAQQMQALAFEIQRETVKPGGGDSKRMQGYMQQLTKLQSQLGGDITVPKTPEVTK